MRASVRVCGGWMGVDKFIQNQADGGGGGGGGVRERSPHCGQIILKIKQILIENTGYTPNFRL